MPFLTLKRVVVDDGWVDCQHTSHFLLLSNALDRMHAEIEHLKKSGATFDENSGPHRWFGQLKNGLRVSVELIDEPFADDARIYAPEITIYSR